MNLKKLIDPKTRYVFLASDEETFAGIIVHVDTEAIYFSSTKTTPPASHVIYFLAQGSVGVVQFNKPRVEFLQTTTDVQVPVHLYRVNFEALDYTIINRRRSFRYEFKDFFPVSFNVFGEHMAARLMNISEGGLRMCVDTPIHKDVLCHLQIKIPHKKQAIRFDTDGVIVYADRNEDIKQITVGISFVTPDFSSDADRAIYLTAKTKLGEFVREKELSVTGNL